MPFQRPGSLWQEKEVGKLLGRRQVWLQEYLEMVHAVCCNWGQSKLPVDADTAVIGVAVAEERPRKLLPLLSWHQLLRQLL